MRIEPSNALRHEAQKEANARAGEQLQRSSYNRLAW